MKSKWLVQLLFIYLCMYLLSIVCMYTVNICIIQPSIVAVFAVRCSLIPNRNVSIVIILYRSTCAFHKKFLMCNARSHAHCVQFARKKKLWNFISDSISFGVFFLLAYANDKIPIINTHQSKSELKRPEIDLLFHHHTYRPTNIGISIIAF